MEELIKEYENSNLNETTKNIRILIVNTERKKQEVTSTIEKLKKLFIEGLTISNIDYEIEPNLNHMMILLKGDILESDFFKNLKNDFSIDDLDTALNNVEGETKLKSIVKLYKILNEINELYLDLRSVLFNTINIVFDKKPEESKIEEIRKEDLIKLVDDEILDEKTYNYLSEFIKFFLDEKAIILTNE